MSDLRDSLKKQRELERQYQDYSMESDKLAAEERKELRRAKSNRNLTQAIGSAVDAIGKIGASKAGGLVSGDLVPELALGDFGASEIEDKYDTKRLEMTEKARALRSKIEDVTDERRIASAEETEKRAAERKKKAEEKALAKSAKAEEKEVFKYNSAARKDADRAIKDDLIADVKNDVIDGEEVVQVLEGKGIPEEMLAPFKETLGIMEDEELQVQTLQELKQKLRIHFIKKRVENDLADGKKFSPVVLEALGIKSPELTSESEPAKIEKPAPEKAPDGEPKKLRYQLTLPNGQTSIILKTPEEAMDIVETAQEKGMKVNLKRLK